MSRRARQCRTRSLDPGHFAQQGSLVLVDDHDAVLTRDEHPVIGRIGNDIIPASVTAKGVSMSDVIRSWGLREQKDARQRDEKRGQDFLHSFPLVNTELVEFAEAGTVSISISRHGPQNDRGCYRF
jgi:hypothetical protein